MKLSKTFLFIFYLFFTFIACDGFIQKPKPQEPSTNHKDVEEIKKTHRKIDSIKTLKKNKSKRSDSLKPSIVTL